MFGVSRTTARTALSRLTQEGPISRRQGIGSIVLEQPLTRLSGFADDMRQRGLTASYRTLAVRQTHPPAVPAAALGLDTDQAAIHIARLLIADDQPMGLAESWLDMAVLRGTAPPTLTDLDEHSLYSWLEDNCGARIAGGTQTIEAAQADRALAEQLDMEVGAPSSWRAVAPTASSSNPSNMW